MKRIIVLLSFLIVSLNGFAQSPFGYPGTVTPFNTTPNFRAGMFLPDTSNNGNFRLRGDTLQVKVNGIWQVVTAAPSGGGSVFAKNGLRKQGDTVKLGLELAPPFTNGLLTEPAYLLMGDVSAGDSWGLSIGNDASRTVQFQSNNASTGNAANILASTNQLSITKENGAEGSSITFNTNNGIEVSSSAPTFKGLSYSSDYSANYVDRSIPDVGWVKELTSEANYVGSDPEVLLTKKGYYSFTGTTTIWNLGSVSEWATARYIIANMGSGNITINAPTNTLWEAGTTMSSTTIAPGETMVIYSNGTYWTIYN